MEQQAYSHLASFSGIAGSSELSYGKRIAFPVDELDVVFYDPIMMGAEEALMNEALGIIENHVGESYPNARTLFCIRWALGLDKLDDMENPEDAIARSPAQLFDVGDQIIEAAIVERPLSCLRTMLEREMGVFVDHGVFLMDGLDVRSELESERLLEAYADGLFSSSPSDWEMFDKLILEGGGMFFSHSDSVDERIAMVRKSIW